MLDKLRRKFIFIIMALVTAALAIMAGVIVFMNYQKLSTDVITSIDYATTEFAFEGRGNPHQGTAGLEAPAIGGDMAAAGALPESPRSDDAGAGVGAAMERKDADVRQMRVQGADMVAMSVYIVSDGTVQQTLVDSLELEDEDLNAAITQVYACYQVSYAGSAEAMSGHLDDLGLFYNARQAPSGLKTAFASDAYIRNSIGNLAMVLGGVSLCVWIAFLLVSIVLARWVVRPTKEAWEQQQRFVADASHELKTPLAVMMANNSILLSHRDETVASQQRWVDSNQAEAHQMLELVNDMLFLARPQNAEREQLLEDVNVSALVQRNTLQFEAVCFERGITLEEDVGGGLKVHGDASRLQRLASTLIDNACKYADHRVSVALKGEGGKVILAVNNDGATIPAEDIPHVFDRFYRVDKARVRSEGGVGLGLAIAQEVAREHGGSIAVTSSEASGTTFTATLPRVM